MRVPQTLHVLLCLPGALAGGCALQPENQPGPNGAPAPTPPERSVASGQCELYQWYSLATARCGETTVETHPVDESVRDTWLDACREYTAETIFRDTSVMEYVEGEWNSFWDSSAVCVQTGTPSDALCDFQFKISALPSSGAVYIGSQDLSDIANDVPGWAGSDHQSVGGKMNCMAPSQSDSNHAEIEWRMIPL